MSMRTTKAQRDAWSDHADRLMTRDNPNELVLSASHTLDLLADLDDALAPPSRTFDDGLRDRVIVALAGYMLKLQGRVIDLPIENMRVEFGDFADAIIAVLRRKDRQ